MSLISNDSLPLRKRGFVFWLIAATVVVGLLIGLGSLLAVWLGSQISLAGHTTNTSLRKVVVANDVLAIPANMMRFERQRNLSSMEALDLYMLWPEGEGYSLENADDFNKTGGENRLIFMKLSRRTVRFDMTARLGRVYAALFEGPAEPMDFGLVRQGLRADSGYDGEALFYEPGSDRPFVARCQTGEATYAPTCLRDVHAGKSLALTYRFPYRFLKDWRAMEGRVLSTVKGFLAG